MYCFDSDLALMEILFRSDSGGKYQAACSTYVTRWLWLACYIRNRCFCFVLFISSSVFFCFVSFDRNPIDFIRVALFLIWKLLFLNGFKNNFCRLFEFDKMEIRKSTCDLRIYLTKTNKLRGYCVYASVILFSF